MTGGELRERLRATCAEVGFDLGTVDPSLLDRLEILGEHSETVADIERMADWALEVFRYYEAEKPAETFGPIERRIVVLGCLFSDIGKTGPEGAPPDGQRLVVEMFGVEGVRDERQSVARFFETYFPGEAAERTARFIALGLDPAMPIREFWNHHAGWTLDIVESAGVPPEAVAAAATHHLLDDVNPERIVGADHRFTRPFGENAAFDRAEKLVIVLDKYDAVRRRGRLSHDAAIAWLRKRVHANPRFRGDHELETLIADLDAVVRARDARAG